MTLLSAGGSYLQAVGTPVAGVGFQLVMASLNDQTGLLTSYPFPSVSSCDTSGWL